MGQADGRTLNLAGGRGSRSDPHPRRLGGPATRAMHGRYRWPADRSSRRRSRRLARHRDGARRRRGASAWSNGHGGSRLWCSNRNVHTYGLPSRDRSRRRHPNVYGDGKCDSDGDTDGNAYCRLRQKRRRRLRQNHRRRTPVVCPAGTTDCGGVCLDLQTDVNNCGACGNVCPEAQPGFDVGCAAGNCFFMREPACGEGLSSCNGVCVNRQTDPLNCGTCGNVCAPGQICFGGQCATDHRCDAGLTNCNNVCVDLLIDPANCGVCGRVCATGEICFGGQCARDNRT